LAGTLAVDNAAMRGQTFARNFGAQALLRIFRDPQMQITDQSRSEGARGRTTSSSMSTRGRVGPSYEQSHPTRRMQYLEYLVTQPIHLLLAVLA
jgi:hypothetical protein